MTQDTNQPVSTTLDTTTGSTEESPAEFHQKASPENSMECGQHSHVPAHFLDDAKPLDPSTFPNQGTGDNGKLPATIPNLMHLLAGYGITVRYNVISKKLEVLIPGAYGCLDNADNSALAQVISLATLNSIPLIIRA